MRFAGCGFHDLTASLPTDNPIGQHTNAKCVRPQPHGGARGRGNTWTSSPTTGGTFFFRLYNARGRERGNDYYGYETCFANLQTPLISAQESD